MGFFGLLVLLFLAYVAYLFLRIFLRVKRVATRARAGTPPQRRDQGMMVKDEVCGTYIPREDALAEKRDGVERYYCSEECRRKAAGR